MGIFERINNWLFGPAGESDAERMQRELAERTRARAAELRAERFAPGLAARMRWDAQVQETQSREHGD